jgi:hypothetical protein
MRVPGGKSGKASDDGGDDGADDDDDDDDDDDEADAGVKCPRGDILAAYTALLVAFSRRGHAIGGELPKSGRCSIRPPLLVAFAA